MEHTYENCTWPLELVFSCEKFSKRSERMSEQSKYIICCPLVIKYVADV